MRHPYAPLRFIRAAILGLALLCPNISHAQDYTSGLVGHWKMDETNGTTATDSSNSSNDGTMTAMDGASDSVTGQVYNALSFTSSSRITAGAAATNIDDIFTGGGTITYWIYPISWGGYGRVMDKSDAGGYPPNTGWHQQGTGTQPIFSHAFSGGTGQWAIASGSTPLNTWSHLSITYNSSDANNDPTFYINGAPVALVTDSNATGTAISDAANPITFGSRQGGGNSYTGYIDDVHMYNRTLTATDITALYAYTGVDYTCSSPDGVTGEMLFNNDARALQYCNASNWIGIGPADSLENGLIGHWQLDETSGSSIADLSGNGNGGTWTDSTGNDVAEETTTGQVGNAIAFDGVDDRINIGNFDVSGTGITMAGWFYLDAFTNDGRLISKSSDADNVNTHDWTLFFDEPGASGRLTLRMKTVNGTRNEYTPYIPNLNEWHHVAVTYNNATDGIIYYIDGAQIDTDTHNDGGAVITGTGYPVAIGNQATGAGERPFDGKLDDWRVYDRPLSASEVSKLYNIVPTCSATTANLAGHWKLDETSGSSIADSSGNGNTGTWNDGTGNDVTEETIAGQDGTAIDFDGGDDRVSIGSDASIENVFNGGGALSMWIYPEGWGGCSYGRILEKAAGITGSGGWSIIVNNGGGVNPKENIAFYKGHSTTYSRWTTPFQSITLNAWNHITVSYSDDNLNNNPTIYINGTAQSLTQNNPPVGTPDSDVGTTMRIGYGGGCGFDGIIDDVRVYDGPLSATEVSSLYGATGGICSVSTCAAPSGTTGEIVFNTDYDVMQYCNGSNWIAMGPPGNGGAGCTNPTGLAAELRYNTDLNVIQYCEGDEWIAVLGTNNASIPTSGLAGHWTLDETSGSSIADSSGNGNTGTWSDGSGNDIAEETITGQVGTALSFDGNDDVVDVGNDASLQITGDQTWAAWIRADSWNSGGTDDIFIAKSTTTGSGLAYQFKGSEDCGSQRLVIQVTSDGSYGSTDASRCSSTVLSTSTWYHVAAVYDASTPALHVYVNGILDDGATINTAPASIHNSAANVTLGTTENNAFEFDGIIDDARIYNRRLSSSEVLSIYNATK